MALERIEVVADEATTPTWEWTAKDRLIKTKYGTLTMDEFVQCVLCVPVVDVAISALIAHRNEKERQEAIEAFKSSK